MLKQNSENPRNFFLIIILDLRRFKRRLILGLQTVLIKICWEPFILCVRQWHPDSFQRFTRNGITGTHNVWISFFRYVKIALCSNLSISKKNIVSKSTISFFIIIVSGSNNFEIVPTALRTGPTVYKPLLPQNVRELLVLAPRCKSYMRKLLEWVWIEFLKKKWTLSIREN